MHSRLISGSRPNQDESPGPCGGSPSEMLYPKSSPAKPSRKRCTFWRTALSTGTAPVFMPAETTSGPAQNDESRPPSRASAPTTPPPDAVCASSRSARYRLDLPAPLGPETTFSAPSPTTSSRMER
jgi:hypothetical protein